MKLTIYIRIVKLHTSDTGDGFFARKVSDMDEGVIERGVNVCNTEDKLSLGNLRTERNSVIFPGDLGFLRRLCIQKSARNPPQQQTKMQNKVAIDGVQHHRTMHETMYAPF
jgi:hypothetical protein